MSDGNFVYRHRLFTRVWHWVNAVAVICMVMSGLMISNAHPHLYWGEFGANLDQPWFNPPTFPAWITIPSGYSLAIGRHWHLFFAWVFAFGLLAYIVVGLINRHIQRDVALTRADVAPRHLWQDIKDHARLRFAHGDGAVAYNPLQKIAYGGTLFVLFPLVILTGLALSPGFDAVTHLTALFGGRSTARSLHFVAMSGIAGFIVVHLALVVLAGPWNEIRSMVTGWYDTRSHDRPLA
ncbi:Cytochrome b561 bacterial/Ni-hydrogenase domain-containing protein [Sphingomonas antarctica]|uniref:cytochrome b/b6 domain-containing protein n=1 Tax=Sphingomonas antarctica TaxID=2040274 RepID=UPI0039EB5C35